MTKQMSKMLIYVSLFFVIVFGWYGVKKILFFWYMSHFQPPPVTISSTVAKSITWQSYLTAVGSLSAINGVDLTTDAAGTVQEIRFNSGQYVKKNDVIVLLDTSVEQAELIDKRAKLKLAEINYQRDKKLFERNVSSQAALDTRFAALQEAQAGVQSVSAQIQQKTITAPFDGRLGIRQVNLGEYVSPGNPIVTLQSLNPLYVMFNLPEQNLPYLYLEQLVDVSVNFGNGKTIRGKVTAINSKVDQTTRNILIQATIPNERFVLYPGMFALVKVWMKEQKDTIVIPQTAVSYSLSGDYVFVIRQEGKIGDEPLLKAYRQYVKTGEKRGDVTAILSGLKSGEKIVTSGQLKLQNGTRVIIDNSVEL
jgi:membrane fusion protein (multidrug efflux system)